MTDGGVAAARGGTLPEDQVRAMFDRIARVYDLLNSVMTVGLHHRWRERAADLAAVGSGDRVLDVATGTGDLAIELQRRVESSGEVVGADFSEGMLELAREKAPHITFEAGNALDLSYEDDSFDAATVGFGVRNLEDLDRGLAELARVLHTGGRLGVLEITRPKGLLSPFYSVWFGGVVPVLGKLLPGGSAYTYLPASVKRFPGPEDLARFLREAGFSDVRYRLFAGGIVALHTGEAA